MKNYIQNYIKKHITIIVICVLVFLFFNWFGGLVIGTAGQTTKEKLLGYLAYAAWGVVFAIILIFVDRMLGRKKKK